MSGRGGGDPLSEIRARWERATPGELPPCPASCDCDLCEAKCRDAIAERDEAVTALRAVLVEACDELERMGDPAATPITSEATIPRLRAVAEGRL